MDTITAKYNHKTKKDDSKLLNYLTKNSVKCKKCGHTLVIVSVDRAICSNCGYWVYKNDSLEFKYKLLEKINKINKEKNI